jgi:hypothetical protein
MVVEPPLPMDPSTVVEPASAASSGAGLLPGQAPSRKAQEIEKNQPHFILRLD